MSPAITNEEINAAYVGVLELLDSTLPGHIESSVGLVNLQFPDRAFPQASLRID